MTEKEKMLRYELFDAGFDRELEEARLRAKELCYDFNALRPSDFDGQAALLRRLIGKTGKRFRITAPFWCDYGFNIELGEGFYANHGLIILDGAKVSFGAHVLVGPNCGFHTAGHPLDAVRRNRGLEYSWPITVGDNVWFGACVQVLPGVTIGDNSIIGAGSVVNRNIPANCIAAGVPCRVLRELTEDDLTREYHWEAR